MAALVGRPADDAEVVGGQLDGQPAPPVGRPADDAEVVWERLGKTKKGKKVQKVRGGRWNEFQDKISGKSSKTSCKKKRKIKS